LRKSAGWLLKFAAPVKQKNRILLLVSASGALGLGFVHQFVFGLQSGALWSVSSAR
jgi:hypothetical protein